MPYSDMSTEQVLADIGRKVDQIRLDQNIPMDGFRGVSRSTVSRFAAGDNIALDKLIMILKQLGRIDELEAILKPAEVDPIAIVDKQTRRQRKRASKGSKADGNDGASFTWGEDVDDR